EVLACLDSWRNELPGLGSSSRGDGGADFLKLGERLGKYRILRSIGRGAQGGVYEAYDVQLERPVALKVCRGKGYLDEARARAALTDPNSVTVFDAQQEGDISYVAMELVEAGNALDWSRRWKELHPEAPWWQEASRLLADACAGLVCAHERGIVHRDIKP